MQVLIILFNMLKSICGQLFQHKQPGNEVVVNILSTKASGHNKYLGKKLLHDCQRLIKKRMFDA